MSDAETILEFIRDDLLEEEVEIDADTSLFRDQLLDSMNLTNLIMFLEETFSIRIGAIDIAFENLDTVNHMLAFIAKKKAADA
jgi:acyl carrier protein